MMSGTLWRKFYMTQRTVWLEVLLMVGLLMGLSSPALAQGNCIEDVTQYFEGDNAVPLNCTSGDVRVATYKLNEGPTSCVAGDYVTFKLRAEVLSGASERYDIGLYVSLDDTDALRGSCQHEYFYPPLTDLNSYKPTSGTGPYLTLENTADTCGDISSSSSVFIDLPPTTILCQDNTGGGSKGLDPDGFLDINTCVSWDNQQNSNPDCTDKLDTYPNTKSKCNCEAVKAIEVKVLGRIIVDKVTYDAFGEKLPGDPTPFSFTLSGTGGVIESFSLKDADEPFKSDPLEAGTYSVAEMVPDGWSLKDATCDDGSSPDAISLERGETVTCTFNNKRTVNADLTVSKTAKTSLSRLYKWQIDKSVDDTRIEIAEGGTATFNYTVALTPEGFTDSDWAVSGQITVANPNDFAIDGVDVTDSIGDVNCTVTGGTDVTVPANGSVTLDYSCSVSSDASGTNTATATWDSASYYTPNSSASGTATVDFKTATLSGETNKTITVIDDKTDPLNPVTLGTANYNAGPYEFTYSLDKPGVAGTCTDYTNTAVIDETDQSDSQKVTVCVGKNLTVTKDAIPTFTRTWDWTIDKETDGEYWKFIGDPATSHPYTVTITPTPTDGGWQVTGKITISNPNDWQSITADVSDAVDNGGACTITGSTTVNVPASGSVQVEYSCTYATAPPSSYIGTNTATATWSALTFFTPDGMATGSTGFEFSDPTEINPVVTVDDDNLTGESWSADRATVGWNYTKEFTCSADPTDYTDGKYSYDLTNTATINETGQTNTATVKVHCYAPLVSKNALAEYTQTINWAISKGPDGEYSRFIGDAPTSHEYQVSVDQTLSEADFAVSGTITVQNPNPNAAMTVALADSVGGTAATLDCGGSLTVPAGGSNTCGYSAPLAAKIDGTNTATVTLNAIDFSATANYAFGDPTTVVGYKDINVTDTNGQVWTASGDTTWTYTKDFTCPTDPSLYTDGTYNASDHVNTATITETALSDTATVKLHCFAPVLSKTASGTYDERHEWDVEKEVNPISQSGFAGDTVPFAWTINVTEEVFEENMDVAGTITVQNPAPMQMTVALADILSDSTAAIINGCTDAATYAAGNLMVPANTTTVCSYTVNDLNYSDENAAPTSNTATATLNGIAFAATDPIEWTANVIRGEAELTDLQGPLSETITGSGTWTIEDSYTCSTDTTDYTSNYSYSELPFNTAKITSGSYEKSSTTSTTITCYIPEISKTAAGSYNERHEWDVAKSVNPVSQSAFAGDTVSYEWKVVATEQTFAEEFVASGTITVVNHNPEDAMTVALSDVLNGTTATISACTGDVDLTDGLTIAAAANSVCDYSANLASINDVISAPTSNTATAVLNGISYSATDPIEWAANVIRSSATLDDDQNPAFLSEITDGGTWTYTEQYTCSTDKSLYEGDNTYTFGESNTATLISGDFNDSATASTSVDCYVPTISKDASGTYDEVHEWEVFKTVNTESQTAFAGEKKNFDWTVRVDETTRMEGYSVTGDIVVGNPNPEDTLTVALSDILSDETVATITSCSGGTWSSPNLTVAAGGTATCDFVANPSTLADSNSVTAVLNDVTFPASANILWTVNKINETATLNDDQKIDWPIIVSDDTTFTYQDPQGYTCSPDPAAYTNGFYQYYESNTAVLTFPTGSDTATASTAVECYAPVVSKTAAGTLDERHEWDVEKTVTPPSQNAFAGDTVSYEWTLAVTESVFEENLVASGNISVKNPRPDDGNMTVKLTDVLSDGFVATITGCTNGTWNATNKTVAVPPGTTAVCSYTASLAYSDDANAPTLNTVIAELMAGTTHLTTTASDSIEWSANVIRGSASLDDDQNPAFPLDLTDGGTWKYTEQYICSTNKTLYEGDNTYDFSEDNTAIITSGDERDRDSASTAVNCYWPEIDLTKTGDELSKISDKVYYDIIVYNNTPVAAGLRALSCTISDTTIGFNRIVTLASGGSDDNQNIEFTIPSSASDPFINTASVTCSPLESSFSVSDNTQWSTNLFQPAVEIIKTGPANATAGDSITYTFTINNKSSADSPNLILDSITDDVLGVLNPPAACLNLAYNGTCTFTADYVAPDPGLQPISKKNIVTVHYHPAGFPNDITDTDDHTVIIVPKSQLTDTSFCPLPNNQFRLLNHLEVAPNVYRLQATNPGQFYFNAFYFGEPGSNFTMTLQIPYPFVTQEGAGVPIQVHDGTGLTSGGCYMPNPKLDNFTIATPAMIPTSSAGNQIITTEDYTIKQLGQFTTITVTGTVPATGMAYVTVHLDLVVKKTGGWKPTGTYTTNPVTGASIADMNNQTMGLTIHGYEVYGFTRTVGGDTATTTPSSYNEFKKFAGFLGFVTNILTGDPVPNAQVKIYNPKNALMTTLTTDADGYYMYPYKHTAKAATYTVKVPTYNKSTTITVKANGFAPVNFEVP